MNKFIPDTKVKIGALELKSPIITASGTFGYADEYSDFMKVEHLGAIITKGMTIEPKEGNKQPRIKELQGGMINSIGLENCGIECFISKYKPILDKKDITYIVNVAGSSIEEYSTIAKFCNDNDIKAIELNLSCPNVKYGCLEFGKDEQTLNKLVSKVRKSFDGTIITKLGSNVSFPEKIAKAAQDGGSDAISAINTVKAMSLTFNSNNKGFKFTKGGLSGSCIKPIALNFIYEIRNYIDIPIIGMGGITCIQDILDFMAVGADAIQIGTASFTYPNISETLTNKLKDYMKNNKISNIKDLQKYLRGE